MTADDVGAVRSSLTVIEQTLYKLMLDFTAHVEVTSSFHSFATDVLLNVNLFILHI